MPGPTIKVTAAVIEKQGCFLAALRPMGEENGGLWEFPGGKIEEGETPQACLKRELREELGIEIEVPDEEPLITTCHDYEKRTIELMAYRAVWLSGALQPREHAALRWAEPSGFHEMNWSPADLPIVNLIIEMT